MAINWFSLQRLDDPTPQIATAGIGLWFPMSKVSLRRLDDELSAGCTAAADSIKGSMPAYNR